MQLLSMLLLEQMLRLVLHGVAEVFQLLILLAKSCPIVADPVKE